MRQARVKQDYKLSIVQAHTGREFVKTDWRPVPNDGHVSELLEYRELSPDVTVKDTAVLIDEPTLAADIEGLSKPELQKLADNAGIEYTNRTTKAELISALKDD